MLFLCSERSQHTNSARTEVRTALGRPGWLRGPPTDAQGLGVAALRAEPPPRLQSSAEGTAGTPRSSASPAPQRPSAPREAPHAHPRPGERLLHRDQRRNKRAATARSGSEKPTGTQRSQPGSQERAPRPAPRPDPEGGGAQRHYGARGRPRNPRPLASIQGSLRAPARPRGLVSAPRSGAGQRTRLPNEAPPTPPPGRPYRHSSRQRRADASPPTRSERRGRRAHAHKATKARAGSAHARSAAGWAEAVRRVLGATGVGCNGCSLRWLLGDGRFVMAVGCSGCCVMAVG